MGNPYRHIVGEEKLPNGFRVHADGTLESEDERCFVRCSPYRCDIDRRQPPPRGFYVNTETMTYESHDGRGGVARAKREDSHHPPPPRPGTVPVDAERWYLWRVTTAREDGERRGRREGFWRALVVVTTSALLWGLILCGLGCAYTTPTALHGQALTRADYRVAVGRACHPPITSDPRADHATILAELDRIGYGVESKPGRSQTTCNRHGGTVSMNATYWEQLDADNYVSATERLGHEYVHACRQRKVGCARWMRLYLTDVSRRAAEELTPAAYQMRAAIQYGKNPQRLRRWAYGKPRRMHDSPIHADGYLLRTLDRQVWLDTATPILLQPLDGDGIRTGNPEVHR